MKNDKTIPFSINAESVNDKKQVVATESSWRALYDNKLYRENLNDELRVLLYDDAVIPGITQADRETLYCNTFDEKGFGISCELKNGQLGTFFLSWPKYLIEMEKRRRCNGLNNR